MYIAPFSFAEYMLDNSGKPNSANNIAGVFEANNVATNHITIRRYMSYLCDELVFYEVPRYDIRPPNLFTPK